MSSILAAMVEAYEAEREANWNCYADDDVLDAVCQRAMAAALLTAGERIAAHADRIPSIEDDAVMTWLTTIAEQAP